MEAVCTTTTVTLHLSHLEESQMELICHQSYTTSEPETGQGNEIFQLPRCERVLCSVQNSSTLATSCEELTHWKRPWCWEGLGAGRKGDNRGWDGRMASPTRWTWVWVNSRRWWWTGRPGVLRFMGSQRVGHDWATELNWTESQE